MAQYSKKRGVGYTKKKLSTEEKRRQWNIDLASRALENMFGQMPVGEDLVEYNSRRKACNYTPEALMEKAQEYFENIVETNSQGVTIVPDVEDFCAFANIPRGRFLAYRRSDDPEMAEAANNISTVIASCKKQNAFAGLINPVAFAMDMNNNHDYVQAKTETTITSNISLQQVETNIADIAGRLPVEDIPLIEKKEDKNV